MDDVDYSDMLFYVSSLRYGTQSVVLTDSRYNYANDEIIINLIKKYGIVRFMNDYVAEINWLPQGTTHITLGVQFNQLLENIPTSVKSITIGNSFYQSYFNQPLDTLNSGIEQLNISSRTFNQSPVNLPPTLRNVVMVSPVFNYPLNLFPDSVETLELSNFDIANTTKLPQNLKSINLKQSKLPRDILKAFSERFPSVEIKIPAPRPPPPPPTERQIQEQIRLNAMLNTLPLSLTSLN
jgi:hypothetical protein